MNVAQRAFNSANVVYIIETLAMVSIVPRPFVDFHGEEDSER